MAKKQEAVEETNDPREASFDPAYRIELEERDAACKTCGHGNMWLVVGPDEIAASTSYEREEDAQDLADDMSSAYLAGWKRGRADGIEETRAVWIDEANEMHREMASGAVEINPMTVLLARVALKDLTR